MDNSDLEQIRKQRMAQLQSQYGGPQNADKQKMQEEQMRQQEEAKNSILSQLLDQQARARLNTLKLSKPEKAQRVEATIIQMAQMGAIGGKLNDEQLIQILERINAQMPQQTSTVKFDRRRAAIDSDDEDYGC